MDEAPGGEESQRPRIPARVSQPTREEVEEHEATSCATFRSWCPHCVAAKGQANPHLDRQGASDIPEVGVDYGFDGRDDEETDKLLCARNPELDHYACTQVQTKGVNRYAVAYLVAWLKSLGYKRVVVRSDDEPALLKLLDVVAGNTDIEMVMKQAPEGDHQANGMAEACVRECKGQIRAVRLLLETKYGVKFAKGEPILAWIPRHAANGRNRYRIGRDGKTAERRRAGRQWRRPTVLFGEAVFFKRAGIRPGAKNSGDARMRKGVFVGHHERTGAGLFLTPECVLRGVGMHRLPEATRWDVEYLRSCRGVPWDTKQAPVAAATTQAAQSDVPAVVVMPAAAEGAPRNFYVLRSDIEKFGPSLGCKGCEDALVGKENKRAHDEECRRRVKELLDRERNRCRGRGAAKEV